MKDIQYEILIFPYLNNIDFRSRFCVVVSIFFVAERAIIALTLSTNRSISFFLGIVDPLQIVHFIATRSRGWISE
jgi:hypothetical protein